jgi:selenocysteine-specific elongation factor
MPRDLILGTAGHIDHGKTSLVKALTGIDCDRLPEEKARGITIDIGFATLDLGAYRLGIVDVPGHERFIKNMLAGATGIDLALFVVAADDSVMPQTREHWEILRLLGLRHGVIALTKCDLVDETTREVAELEIRELVQDSFLAQAAIVPTSVRTGEGIDELKKAIAEACRQVEERTAGEWFRLAIDRSFALQGHGTVVTGSVISGRAGAGDELAWLPQGQKVRVRSLQNHGQPVTEVHRGMRAAINLTGVHHKEVVRGQELATAGYLVPARTLTVRLHCLAGTRPIKHRLPIRLHIGTAEVLGVVALLDADVLEPGEWRPAQFFLEAPVLAVWGQAFVLRESAATQTLGGGQVLQPVAHKLRRRNADLLHRLQQLGQGNVEERALTAAWLAGIAGITPAALVRDAGAIPGEAEEVVVRLTSRGDLVILRGGQSRPDIWVHAGVIRSLEQRILEALSRLHEQSPLVTMHDRQKVLAPLAYIGNEALFDCALERLLQAKKVVGDLRRLARADFRPKLSAGLHKLREKVVAAYREAGLKPPKPATFAGLAGGNAGSLHDLVGLCVAEGQLVHITEDFYLSREAEAQMRRLVSEHLSARPGATVAEIRDILGAGRHNTILMCEYLDRIGVTRRQGDLRWLAN